MADFKDLRIIFMGTPEFAVTSLDALVSAGANVIAVVTAPDKPAGRGMKINESAVKKYAREKELFILQPEKLKDPDFIRNLRALHADLQIVVAFRMLPEIVWNMPPMGTVNLHGSLLPQYRGAAPINWAVMNGEKTTGVTTFQLKQEIDTGNILLQEPLSIGENETAGDVHDRMKEIGARLVVQTVKGLADGNLHEIKQHDLLTTNQLADLKPAPKINTDTCKINWDNSVQQVYNQVRGLSPYPTAFTILNEKMLKIYQAKMEITSPAQTQGSYETDGKTFLKFVCTNGYLHLLEVQLAGKKKLTVEEFLRGFHFT